MRRAMIAAAVALFAVGALGAPALLVAAFIRWWRWAGTGSQVAAYRGWLLAVAAVLCALVGFIGSRLVADRVPDA